MLESDCSCTDAFHIIVLRYIGQSHIQDKSISIFIVPSTVVIICFRGLNMYICDDILVYRISN